MNIPMIIFLFILIAGGLLGLEIYRELHHFRVTHYTIESQKFKGFSRDLSLIFLFKRKLQKTGDFLIFIKLCPAEMVNL